MYNVRGISYAKRLLVLRGSPYISTVRRRTSDDGVNMNEKWEKQLERKYRGLFHISAFVRLAFP
jgi:hypothetical protein